MKKLTKKYLLDHAVNIHNYDSFGRTVALAILQAAAHKIEAEGAQNEGVELSMRISIQPNLQRECVTLTIQLPPGLGGSKTSPPPIPPPIILHVGNR